MLPKAYALPVMLLVYAIDIFCYLQGFYCIFIEIYFVLLWTFLFVLKVFWSLMFLLEIGIYCCKCLQIEGMYKKAHAAIRENPEFVAKAKKDYTGKPKRYHVQCFAVLTYSLYLVSM